MDYIVESSGGTFNYEWYPTGSLVSLSQSYDGVVSGICDLSMNVPGENPGRFPLTEILELPPGFVKTEDTVLEGQFFNDYLANPQWTDEWSDVKVLTVLASTPNVIMANKPIRTLEDAKGLRVCGTGLTMELWQVLGATPTGLGPADAYEAIQRGMADAGYFSAMWALVRKGAEVAPYLTEELGVNISYNMVYMNPQKYNALPDDIKKIFDEVFPEKLNQWQVEIYLPFTQNIYNFIEESGGEVVHISAEEAALFQAKAMKAMNDKWAADKDAQGLPGTKLLQERYKFLKQYMPEVFEALESS